MSKIIPLVLRKEQNSAKQIRIELNVNGNQITSLGGKINKLKLEQQNFTQVLNQSFKPAHLVKVHQAVRMLNADAATLKSEILKIRNQQSELNKLLLISDKKVEKLQTNIKLKKLLDIEQKEQSDIDDISSLSKLGSGHKHEVANVCSSVLDNPFVSVAASNKNITKSSAPIVDASINGTLKLNESQSVSVNIDANNNLDCDVMITATKGVTEALMQSSKKQLKKQVEKQGLEVASFEVQGVE